MVKWDTQTGGIIILKWIFEENFVKKERIELV